MKTFYLHVTVGDNFHWFTVEAENVREACRLLDAYEAGIRHDRPHWRAELQSISLRPTRKVKYEPLIPEI